jgi:hypothetical protein
LRCMCNSPNRSSLSSRCVPTGPNGASHRDVSVPVLKGPLIEGTGPNGAFG